MSYQQEKMSDRDLMEMMLNEHKWAAMSMSQCILECANSQIRQECTNILNRTLEHHYIIWEAMNRHGWYRLLPASPQDVIYAQQMVSIPATTQASTAQTSPKAPLLI